MDVVQTSLREELEELKMEYEEDIVCRSSGMKNKRPYGIDKR